MAYKISQINLDRFREGAELGEDLSNLDVRLGLEGMVYHPLFRERASFYWNGGQSSTATIAPTGVCQMFRNQSPRHRSTTDQQIQTGLERILDDPDFRQTCTERWVQQDSEPPGQLPPGASRGRDK